MTAEYWVRLPTTEHPFETIDPQAVIAGTALPIPVKGRDGRVIGQMVELRLDAEGWLVGRVIVDDPDLPRITFGFSVGTE